MYKKLLVLFIILNCALHLAAAHIFFRGMASYNMHLELEKKDMVTADIPIPGIGQFYDNGTGYNVEIGYLANRKTAPQNLLFTAGLAKHAVNSEEEVFDYYFGEKIKISKLYLMAGAQNYLGSSNLPDIMRPCLHISVGPAINYYHGKSEIEGIRMEFDYKPTITFRVAVGFDYPFSQELSGSIILTYDGGNIKRGNLNYYAEDEWLAEAAPTGNSTINDDQLILSLGITCKYFSGNYYEK